jgi:hypothetical protein
MCGGLTCKCNPNLPLLIIGSPTAMYIITSNKKKPHAFNVVYQLSSTIQANKR